MTAVNDKPVLEVIHDPDAILDYGFTWTKWLAGDTIAASSWVFPAGSGLVQHTVSFDNTSTTIWISGGNLGEWDVLNVIVTAAGRTDRRTIRLVVEAR